MSLNISALCELMLGGGRVGLMRKKVFDEKGKSVGRVKLESKPLGQ